MVRLFSQVKVMDKENVITIKAGLLLALVVSAAAVSCPTEWTLNPETGTCLFISKDSERTDWYEARIACQQHGADLVKIASSAANTFITDLLPASKNGFWIGFNDRREEKEFVWNDETSKVNFTNWKDGEPSDDMTTFYNPLEVDGEDCAVIGDERDQQDLWTTAECGYHKPYICELQTSVKTKVVCPSGWSVSSSSESCVKLVDGDAKMWYEARGACANLGGDLVKIVNLEMNDLVAELVAANQEQDAEKKYYWIGLHDRVKEDYFVWLDETEEAKVFHWYKTSPNNKGDSGRGTGEDCVVTGVTAEYNEWEDTSCSYQIGYICELFPDKKPVHEVCPSGWTESKVSGTCIKRFDDPQSWFDARASCQNVGADLVKVTSDDMSNLISELSGDSGKQFWIGLHDRLEEGVFVWLDETTEAKYTNWTWGETFDQGSTSELFTADCVTVGQSRKNPAEWSDDFCSYRKNYFCELALRRSPQVRCPPGWTSCQESETCLLIKDSGIRWSEARETCQAQGADLVKITSPDMNDFITSLVIPINSRNGFWIGLNDLKEEDVFVWLGETEEANFTNWGDGEPRNDKKNPFNPMITEGEDCAEIGADYQLKDLWSTVDCEYNRGYICELNPNEPFNDTTSTTASVAKPSSLTELLVTKPVASSTSTNRATSTEAQKSSSTAKPSSTLQQTLSKVEKKIDSTKKANARPSTTPRVTGAPGSVNAARGSDKSSGLGTSYVIIIIVASVIAALIIMLAVSYGCRSLRHKYHKWSISEETGNEYTNKTYSDLLGLEDAIAKS